MKLYEEIYFEITLSGTKRDLANFVNYIKTRDLDEFLEITEDHIFYDDNFETAGPYDNSRITISNDDYGIELDELDPDEFLEAFCRAGKNLYIKGTIFDIDDEEYQFVSEEGDNYYINSRSIHYHDDDEDEEI